MFFPPHLKFLLCKPSLYDVTYEINPWMDISVQPDKALALRQWSELEKTLQTIGAELYYIEQQPGIPDQVFTANGGLVRGKRCVLPTFRYPERQKETPVFRAWFEAHNYEVFEPTQDFEGEGDALFQGQTLYGGCGFRSDASCYDSIQKFLEFEQLVRVKLINPYFYHLDTCFAPISRKEAIFFPGAFDKESIKAMEKHTNLVAVPDNEAENFCCNCVVIGDTVVIPLGSSQTRKILELKSFKVHEVGLSEFKKAGGAAKCLSLKI